VAALDSRGLYDAVVKTTALKVEKDRLEKEQAIAFDYKGLMSEIARLSGVGAGAESIVRKMKFDPSLAVPIQGKTKTYAHDVPALETHVKEVVSLIGDKVIPPQKIALFQDTSPKGRRAYIKGTGNAPTQINVGLARSAPELRKVIFHELGHLIEQANPQKADIALKWVKSRSPQKRPVPLVKINPKSKAGADEVVYPDEFADPYIGRSYEKWKLKKTEVISTGVEALSSPETAFMLYSKDREHFLLTLGLMAG
jgi:hypothetical protein